MVSPVEAGVEFNNSLKEWGTQVRFKYFTRTFPGGGSYYDDDLILAQSGTDLWISGVVQPIDSTEGSEQLLLEQGRILQARS